MNRLFLAALVCLSTSGFTNAQTTAYRQIQTQPRVMPQYQIRYITRVFYFGPPGRQRKVIRTYAQKYIPQPVTPKVCCNPAQQTMTSSMLPAAMNAKPAMNGDAEAATPAPNGASVGETAPSGELPLVLPPSIDAPGITDSAPTEPYDTPLPPAETEPVGVAPTPNEAKPVEPELAPSKTEAEAAKAMPEPTPAVKPESTPVVEPEPTPVVEPEPKPESTPTPEPAAEATTEPAPTLEPAVPGMPKEASAENKPVEKPKGKKKGKKVISLFDGKTLKGWKKTNFGGEGDVEVENGVLILNEGADMTGVHTERKLPKTNYEVEFDAQRIDGSDFFVGFTFPVNKKFCSLIMGGWGGGVCGLSSIDGYDASENPTTSYQEFKKGQWYHVRLRVTKDKIEAWLDKDKVVDQTTTDRDLSIRFEVEPSKPMGFASFQTIAGLKNIKLRPVNKPDSPPEKE